MKNAYTLYKESRVGVSKSYTRFAEDLISSLTYADCSDIDCDNAHAVNVNRLKSLLGNDNEALVRKYFDAPYFSDSDCDALIAEFNLTGLTYAPAARPIPTFRSSFTPAEIAAITETANALGIFTPRVSEEQMAALFNCTLEQPLKATKNRLVVAFFEELSREHLICSTWQNVLYRHGYIISSKTDRPLMRSNLSVALSDERIKMSPSGDILKIRAMVREIARNRQNEDSMT